MGTSNAVLKILKSNWWLPSNITKNTCEKPEYITLIEQFYKYYKGLNQLIGKILF